MIPLIETEVGKEVIVTMTWRSDAAVLMLIVHERTFRITKLTCSCPHHVYCTIKSLREG